VATTILPTPEATIAFGRELAASLEAGDVLALCGDLGAGKTHFVKGVAAGLAIECEATSPTFTIVHEYPGGRLPLFHIDWYRLDDPSELRRIEFDDYLAEGGVIAIEWADKFRDAIPPRARWFEFRFREDGTREVTDASAKG
jgi:tRNA threonylcarbamoyladenosine biosynthesis protein TsaE